MNPVYSRKIFLTPYVHRYQPKALSFARGLHEFMLLAPYFDTAISMKKQETRFIGIRYFIPVIKRHNFVISGLITCLLYSSVIPKAVLMVYCCESPSFAKYTMLSIGIAFHLHDFCNCIGFCAAHRQ